MKVKELYFEGRKVILQKGDVVRFWKDPWLDGYSLCVSYPGLFDICQAQDWTFEKVLSVECEVPFRRRFLPGMIVQWNYIVNAALQIVRSTNSDKISWSLNANGIFSTKSVYQLQERNLVGSHNKWIWKAKLPLKIKV